MYSQYPDAKSDSQFSRSAGKVSEKQAAIVETIVAMAKRMNTSIETAVLLNEALNGDWSDAKKIAKAEKSLNSGKLHWTESAVEMLRAACDWFFCYR